MANVAQLVEQVIRNDQVVGSAPTVGYILVPVYGEFRASPILPLVRPITEGALYP